MPRPGPAPLPNEFGSFPSPRAAEEFDLLVERCRAYAPLLRPGQFFSHTTAARLWKAPMPGEFTLDEPLHVSVFAPGRAPRSRGIVGHRAPAGIPVVDRFGLPTSDPAATWLSLGTTAATRLGHDDLVAVADHLVLDPVRFDPHDPRPYASIAQLGDRLLDFSGPGSRAAASAILDVREHVESRQETRLRLVLVRAGLPEPELGVDIYDDLGRWLGRADQLFREWKVISEYDGEQHRTSSAQYDRDQIRLDDFRQAGYTTVQTRKRQLYPRPEVAVARVARTLWAAGCPG
ncbi:hypothetical protein HD599_002861 [Conyzicola lurida]|uniref:DUF559 domain-containing protein n=1 Tax=Conyzicola lurida TaxID=1172621 RepID=A0A841AQH2_9MICO|nr:hypothetical protein [Conyzicola lurida]